MNHQIILIQCEAAEARLNQILISSEMTEWDSSENKSRTPFVRQRNISKWRAPHDNRLPLYFISFSPMLGINGPKDLLIEYESLLIKLQLYMEDSFRGFLNLDIETRSLPGILICDRGMSHLAISLYIYYHSDFLLWWRCICLVVFSFSSAFTFYIYFIQYR